MDRDPPTPPDGLDECRALLRYDGPARQLVTGLKYRNDRRALSWLAEAMQELLLPPAAAVVTWVPTTASRRSKRGFDQAALLARALGRRWHVPCQQLLERLPGAAQTGRTLAERSSGVTVQTCRGVALTQTPIVLVDDVVTSGATLRSGADVLRDAGATWIGAVTIARTPRRS